MTSRDREEYATIDGATDGGDVIGVGPGVGTVGSSTAGSRVGRSGEDGLNDIDG